MLDLPNITHVPHHGSATLSSTNWIRVHRKPDKLHNEVHWRFVHELKDAEAGEILKTSTDRCSSTDLAEYLLNATVMQPLHVCMLLEDKELLEADIGRQFAEIH